MAYETRGEKGCPLAGKRIERRCGERGGDEAL